MGTQPVLRLVDTVVGVVPHALTFVKTG